MSALDDLKKRRDDEDDLSPLEFVILRDSGEWSGAPEESEKAATELAQLRADFATVQKNSAYFAEAMVEESKKVIALRAELDAERLALVDTAAKLLDAKDDALDNLKSAPSPFGKTDSVITQEYRNWYAQERIANLPAFSLSAHPAPQEHIGDADDMPPLVDFLLHPKEGNE